MNAQNQQYTYAKWKTSCHYKLKIKVYWLAGTAAGVSQLSINFCSCITCDIGEDIILYEPKFCKIK